MKTMEALDLLLGRDSAVRLSDPGPREDELAIIFESAVRAPDHGRLRPWRFVIISGDKRERFGELLAASLKARQPDAPAEQLQREREKAQRAPIIVAVAAHLVHPHKIPEQEQLLAAGAAAQNIMLAAHAQGYGAMWKTGEAAYDPAVKQALGLDPADEIVGFLYLGTRVGGASPLPRPAVKEFVSVWQG
jgi:nitroreductase